MKASIVFLLFLVTSTAFARQYIQCSDLDSWDRAVVNLNGDASTLFMTNGVHLPDDEQINVLKALYFSENTTTHAVFVTDEGSVKDIIKVPLKAIGQYSSYVEVIFAHQNINSGYTYERVMYCFSAIYND
jgi:hypothetical protein